jgi:hypothetical protein
MVFKGKQFTSLISGTPEFVADCDGCGGKHPAEPSHEGHYGEGQIYAVVCPEDLMTQYHTRDGIEPYTPPKRRKRR